MNNLNLDQMVTDDQLRIIGVEFNILTPTGQIQEMAMFVPNGNGLLIPRSRSGMGRSNYGEYRPLITFHSTVGDHTIGRNDWGCPW